MLKQISSGGTKRRFMPKRTDFVQDRDLYEDKIDHNKNQSVPNASQCFNLLDNHVQKHTNNNTTEDLIDEGENFEDHLLTEADEGNLENTKNQTQVIQYKSPVFKKSQSHLVKIAYFGPTESTT